MRCNDLSLEGNRIRSLHSRATGLHIWRPQRDGLDHDVRHPPPRLTLTAQLPEAKIIYLNEGPHHTVDAAVVRFFWG